MNLSRRRALFGLLAAPAIVAAPSLMRVSSAALESTLAPPGADIWRFDVLYGVKATVPMDSVLLSASLADFSERYLKPQMAVLADVMDRAISRETYTYKTISLRLAP